MTSTTRSAFRDNITSLPLGSILPQRDVPDETKRGNIFKQIISSIREIGLVEPLAVFPRETGFLLLDGHLRLEALKMLGIKEVRCLIATDDEAYTYNKRVNHIPPVAQHFMLLEALKSGVSEKRIATALNIDVTAVRSKIHMLDGIWPEVVGILRNKHLSPVVFGVLRKMKPAIQIATTELMSLRNDFTVSFAKTRLALTPPNLLVDPPSNRKVRANALVANAVLEEDTENLVRNLKAIEESYGTDILALTVCCSYFEKVLGNERITRYLEKNHPGVLGTIRNLLKDAGSRSAERSAA
jgi:hypothetical protein